jgi:Fur family ferric uptake transcriptional regulator
LHRLSARVQLKLKENDIRLTQRRKAILETLAQATSSHLSADEIYLKIKQSDSNVGLATVYRTLDLFAEAGIVHVLDFGDGFRRFELVSDNAPHYHHHLICLVCGDIAEFDHDLLENLEHKVEEMAKFRVINHSLRFYGYCEQCQEKGLAIP